MKTRGYTLIELIAVIAIVLILFVSGISIISILSNIKKEVEAEEAIYEIHNILSYAKAYSRKEKCELSIGLDKSKNKMKLYKGSTLISENDISDNIKIDIKVPGGITINEFGYIKKSGTILVTTDKEVYRITIAVGNDLITVKDPVEIPGGDNSDL